MTRVSSTTLHPRCFLSELSLLRSSDVQGGKEVRDPDVVEREILDIKQNKLKPLEVELEEGYAMKKLNISLLDTATNNYIATTVGTHGLVQAPLKHVLSIDLSNRFLRERIGLEGFGDRDADVGKLLDMLARCMGREGMNALTGLNIATPGATGSFVR